MNTISADMPLGEAGRLLLQEQVAIIEQHQATLASGVEARAVHETRKAIRRTLTLFKLYAVAFEPHSLRRYRRWLKKQMWRLGRCRDTFVFATNLQTFQNMSDHSFECLLAHWGCQQQRYNDGLRRFLNSPRRKRQWHQYASFSRSDKQLPVVQTPSTAAEKLRYHIPWMIFGRLAAVRAKGESLEKATYQELHQFRLRYKELRYTLQFFESLLGTEIAPFITAAQHFQEHLGLLNDAAVALHLLDESPNCAGEVVVYGAYQQAEYERLAGELFPLWTAFDTADNRRQLAANCGRL